MTSTPAPNIRLTISVTPEVHATFERIAKSTSRSISRAMGEWLGDTLEAADYMANTVERARAAPKAVIQELQAYTLGVTDELGTLMETVRRKGDEDRRARAVGEGPRLRGEGPAARRLGLPPSSNTGGKGTGKGTGNPGGIINQARSK
jgi:hypothetical protein